MFNFLKKNLAAVTGALFKTTSHFAQKLAILFKGPLTEEALEQFEELLIEANFGTKLTSELTQIIRKAAKETKTTSQEALVALLEKALLKELTPAPSLSLSHKPSLILIVGVNGAGKTTTIAKLSHLFTKEGLRVMIAAADTFRAAALEQLQLWCERLSLPLVTGPTRSDPASVVFAGCEKALQEGVDILLIDTAGRLESKTDLLAEMEKLSRVAAKKVPGAPHETLLIVDATQGQNAIEQAKIFHKYCPLTGLIVTKIDSSSRAGAVFAIQRELKIPIRFLGTGEGAEDLLPFDPPSFVSSLLTS